MATSDRTQYKQVLIGVVGAMRTVVNSALMVAQDAQRYFEVAVGAVTPTTAASTYTLPVARLDRPVRLTEVRIIPGGALTNSTTVFETLNFGYTNDNGGALIILAAVNTNTVPNGGTGTWALGTSIVVAPNLAVNQVIPSGSQVQMTITPTSTGTAVPAGTLFQMIWEEV